MSTDNSGNRQLPGFNEDSAADQSAGNTSGSESENPEDIDRSPGLSPGYEHDAQAGMDGDLPPEDTSQPESRDPDTPDRPSPALSSGQEHDTHDEMAVTEENGLHNHNDHESEANYRAGLDPDNHLEGIETEDTGEHRHSPIGLDSDIENAELDASTEVPIPRLAEETVEREITETRRDLIGLGPGTTGRSDHLYFVSSRDNLRYLLSQGYIGPIYNRNNHRDDFLRLYKGSVLLLSSPIGLDAIQYVSGNDLTINPPFAIRIPISDLEGYENTLGIDQNGKVEQWDLETRGIVGTLVHGAIPISSETTIFARSESDLKDLKRGLPNNPHVPSDRYRFEASQMGDVFSVSQSNIGALIDAFEKDEDNDQPSVLDNRLDRLAGGFSSALWLSQLEGSNTESMALLHEWITTAVASNLGDQDAVNKLIRSLHEAISIIKEPELKSTDLWVFEQITNYLLELSVDGDGWGRHQLINALESRLEGADLGKPQKEKVGKGLEYVRTFLGGDAPSIYGVFRKLSDPGDFSSLRSLLLTVVSINSDVTPNGLKRFLEEPAINQRQLLLAALWIGLGTGRRAVDTQYRPEELDKVLSRWTASQLTGGQLLTSWKEDHLVIITPELQEHNGDEVKLAIGHDVILQRRYTISIPTLKEMFTDGDRESQNVKEAALYLCKQVPSFNRCMRTGLTYPATRHIANTTTKKSPLTFTLELEGSFILEETVEWKSLLSGLDKSEDTIPDDIKTEVAKLIGLDAETRHSCPS